MERGGFGVVFKAGFLGFAERMDVGEEGKGKFVTLSLWASGGNSVLWNRSRFGDWGKNEEFCFVPIDFEMPLRQPSGAANQVIHVGPQGEARAGDTTLWGSVLRVAMTSGSW